MTATQTELIVLRMTTLTAYYIVTNDDKCVFHFAVTRHGTR